MLERIDKSTERRSDFKIEKENSMHGYRHRINIKNSEPFKPMNKNVLWNITIERNSERTESQNKSSTGSLEGQDTKENQIKTEPSLQNIETKY